MKKIWSYLSIFLGLFDFKLYNLRGDSLVLIGYLVRSNSYHSNRYDVDYLVNHFVSRGHKVMLINFRSLWSYLVDHSVFVGFGLSYRMSTAKLRYLFHTEGPQKLCQVRFDIRFFSKNSGRVINRCNKFFRHEDEISAKNLIFLGNDFDRWGHVKGEKINYWPKVPALKLNHTCERNKILFVGSHGAHFKGLDVLRLLGKLDMEVYVIGVSAPEFNRMSFPSCIVNMGWIDLEASIDFLSQVKIAFSFSVSEACPTGLFQLWKSGIEIVLSDNCGIKRNSLFGISVVRSEDELIRKMLELMNCAVRWPSHEWTADIQSVEKVSLKI